MAAPVMKTLRVSLADLELSPVGSGMVTGEVWVALTGDIRTTDGQMLVIPGPKRLFGATGIVDFEVPANDDANINSADRGFGVVVSWHLVRNGTLSLGVSTRTVLITTATSDPVYLTSLVPVAVTTNFMRWEPVTGTGSPESVVTAPVGTKYIDSAATRGAVEWIKATGTGNTGWKVTYGDTGWRDISSLLLNGWTGVFKCRRINDVVYYVTDYYGIRFLTATNSVFFNPNGVDSGFWVHSNGAVGVEQFFHAVGGSGTVFGSLYWYQTGAEAPNFTNNWRFQASAPVTRAWPAVLPGV